nr:solute carrier family 33 [Hymenolepis microstoma]
MAIEEEEETKSANQYRFLSRIRNSTAWKDLTNILLLVFLYMLQGIPLGLSSVVPLLLQSNKKTASYRDVGIFSWVSWTFSLKLTWAPFVDTFYFKRIGRRKSWLIPVQFAIGGVCFVIGGYVDRWFGRPEGDPWGPLGTTGDVQIFALTAAFFGLNFLAATQDIAVDGWAISMLSK